MTQPTSVVRNRQKLLSRRPAAIKRTTVVAISTVSKVLRMAVRDWLPFALRDEACSAAVAPLRVDEIAGSSPASKAVTAISAQANASTMLSTWMLCALGRFLQVLTSHFVVATDNSKLAHAACNRDQQALHQLLANQRHPSRPERAPDGDFFLPRSRPCQNEVGHIEANRSAASTMQPTTGWSMAFSHCRQILQ